MSCAGIYPHYLEIKYIDYTQKRGKKLGLLTLLNTANKTAQVFKSIGGVVLAIVILLAMVTIHEFGHYVAGKLLGFKINEFAVGFGPAIFKKRSKKTGELFALRAIPLGGYCAFDGEDDGEDEENDKNTDGEKTAETDGGEPFAELSKKDAEKQNQPTMSALNDENSAKTDEYDGEEYPEPKGERFNNQPPWKRIIVLLAGATMNYLLALVLIMIMFTGLGRPMYEVVKHVPGENPHENALITYETPLQTGDVILQINGKDLYLVTDFVDALKGKKQGEMVAVTVLRDGKEQTLQVPLYEDADMKSISESSEVLFLLGIAARAEVTDENGQTSLKVVRSGGFKSVEVKDGFFQTIGHSFVYSWKIGGTVLRSLGELLTGKMGIEAMGGPITTIQVTSQAATNGLSSFLNIASFIGVNLAVFNLLPIPALDGCKTIFCIIEWIRKKPVNRKVEAMIHFIGIIFLFGFAILVDLLQLF